MLLRTSDSTWQAYNIYGGNSLYRCTVACPPGNPRALQGRLLGVLQPAVRRHDPAGRRPLVPVLRRVPDDPLRRAQRLRRRATRARSTSPPTPRSLRNHKLIISSGHDEYWSGPRARERRGGPRRGREPRVLQRQRGVLEDPLEPSGTDGRGAVPDADELQGHALRRRRPTRWTWTGTWRDPRFARRARRAPENSLTGQLFIVNSGSSDITVPGRYKNLRLWRNTAVANLGAQQTADARARAASTLGYEWDIDVDNGFRPAGAVPTSRRRRSAAVESFTDYGSTVQPADDADAQPDDVPGAERRAGVRRGHRAVGVGPGHHERVGRTPGRRRAAPDPVMQQATVNLFADMGAQATTLDERRCPPALASTDTTAPQSTITSPAAGAAIADGTRVTISGTATDTRRHGRRRRGLDRRRRRPGTRPPARRRGPTPGSPTARRARRSWRARSTTARNLETTPASVPVDIGCPCTPGGPERDAVELVDSGDINAIEVGVRFKSDLDGTITGVRFYKATRATPARTSATCGRPTARCSPRGTFTDETRHGLAAADLRDAGEHRRRDDVHRVLLRAARALLVVRRAYYYKPQPDRRQRRSTPAAARAQRQRRRRQRRLQLRPRRRASRRSTATARTTRSTSSSRRSSRPAREPASPRRPAPARRPSTSSPRSTGGVPTRYIVTPFIGSAAQRRVTVTGCPPATTVVRQRAQRRDRVHVPRPGGQRRAGRARCRRASNAVTPTAAGRAGRADRRSSRARATAGQRCAGPRRTTAAARSPATRSRRTSAAWPQATTTVTGSPAPTTAIVTGLTNGSTYTFTVARDERASAPGPTRPRRTPSRRAPAPRSCSACRVAQPAASPAADAHVANVTPATGSS